EYLNDLQNLGNNFPLFAGILAVLLFSFAGIPPFIGFFAKYELILGIFNNSPIWWIFCIIGSIISAFYYMSIISLLYFTKLEFIIQSVVSLKNVSFLMSKTKKQIFFLYQTFFSNVM